MPLQGTIYRKPDDSPWEFTVDGIYDSPLVGTDKTQFFFHYKYLNETISQNFGRDQVGWYIVKVANPAEADDVAKRMDALFANSPAETKTATEKAFVADFAKQVGDIGAIMTGDCRGGDHSSSCSSPAMRWRSRSASGPTSSRS